MKKIKLTQGYEALVSNKDYKRVSCWKWHAMVARKKDGSINHVYAGRADYSKDYKNPERILMRRFIMNVTDPTVEVDHKDHWGLNNQRKNLRKCTVSQNQQNCRTSSRNTSGFKGVRKHGPSWIARIMKNGKQHNLGCYPTPIEAAKAYNKRAIELFGEFANLNSITGG